METNSKSTKFDIFKEIQKVTKNTRFGVTRRRCAHVKIVQILPEIVPDEVSGICKKNAFGHFTADVDSLSSPLAAWPDYLEDLQKDLEGNYFAVNQFDRSATFKKVLKG